MAHHYRELIAWQKALAMVTDAYGLARGFPKEEIYGLTSQIRHAAVSVPSNIAEGQGRRSKGEFKQFLGPAFGSLLELETQVIIVNNLGYLDLEVTNRFLAQSSEVGRIINGLIVSLKS